jgi:signal transduction histidine kinase
MVYAGQGPWQVDWHMYFFVVFGMLVVFVDWRPIALAAALTIVHNLALDLIHPPAVFPEPGLGRVALHAGLVVVDYLVLFWIASLMLRLFLDSRTSLASAEEAASEARQLESYAKHGSDLIMQAVNQGLLLCDEHYRIQPQYSAELEKIFRTKNLAGRNLLDLLEVLLPDRAFATTRDFIEMLFDPKRKERTVLKVNPLAEVECTYWDDIQRDFASKVLSFSFHRIVEGERVTRLFVAVNDITERASLERQLHQAEQKKERQVEMLLSILNIDSRRLDEFVRLARSELRATADALKAQDFADARAGQRDVLGKRLEASLRRIKKLRSHAALIGFEYFRRRAEDFENKLADVRARTLLGGDDFLSVALAQAELSADLEELETLRARVSGGPRNAGGAHDEAAPAADDVVGAIEELAASLGQRLNKDVRVDAAGFDTSGLSETQRRAIKDVLLQLTHNSLTHGVEMLEVRQLLGKEQRATLTIRRVSGPAEEFSFIFRDDGGGFNIDRIRRTALERGLISRQDPRASDDSGVVGLAFEDGFSTSEASGGKGLGIVKQRIIDECNGKFSVRSELGRFCEFSFSLPLAEVAHA